MQPLPNNPEHDPMQPPAYNPELDPIKSAEGFSNHGFKSDPIPYSLNTNDLYPSQNQFHPIVPQNNFIPPPQYQYNPSTINQGNLIPGQYIIPPDHQSSYNAYTNQLVVSPMGIQRSRGYLDFTAAIVLSCLTFWCCGVLFGLIAFILAMVGQSSAAKGDETNARCLRTASYALSTVGIVVMIVLVIVLISIARTSGFTMYSTSNVYLNRPYGYDCFYNWCRGCRC